MFTDRFAGMASAVGVVLIIAIISWLGLLGPLDTNAVKGWQTLITGCLAIVAACIAYWGSSSQARLNERIHQEENARRQLALYLKMEFACRQLVDRSRVINSSVTFPPFESNRVYGRSGLILHEPPEIEEAWSHLDLLPRTLVFEIRSIRNSLRELADVLQDEDPNRYIWPVGLKKPPPLINRVRRLTDVVWQSAAVVADTLEPLIDMVAPEMDQAEKIVMLYGDGHTDD